MYESHIYMCVCILYSAERMCLNLKEKEIFMLIYVSESLKYIWVIINHVSYVSHTIQSTSNLKHVYLDREQYFKMPNPKMIVHRILFLWTS